MLVILIGTIPAALLRWVILRRPLSLWPAVAISFLILIGLAAIWDAVGGKSQTPVGAATALSFTILWGCSPKSGQVYTNQPTRPPPLPQQPVHLGFSSESSVSATKESPAKVLPLVKTEITPIPQEPPSSLDIERRLIELKALFDKGLITESDYSVKKTKILSNL